MAQPATGIGATCQSESNRFHSRPCAASLSVVMCSFAEVQCAALLLLPSLHSCCIVPGCAHGGVVVTDAGWSNSTDRQLAVHKD